MDCQRCESLLLDLAYGELPAVEEAEARAHLARCAQCATALERISGGLALAKQMPLVAPPTSLNDTLMHAAQVHVQEAKPVPATPFFDRLIDLLRHFAMARQVQMATVMLLIVVIGLWSVPELTRRREAQGGTVIGPDDQGEAGPSAALAPAEPLDLAVDRRTGRIRAKGDLPEPAPARATAEKLASATGAEAREGHLAEAPELLGSPSTEAALAEAPAAPPPAKAAEVASAAPEGAAPSTPDDALMGAEGELAVHAFAPAPPTAASAQKARRAAAPLTDALLQPSARSSGAGAATLGASRADLDEANVGELSKRAASQPTYAAALERFRAGDYHAARDMLLAVLARPEPTQRAGALLFLARSERELGLCRVAVGRYEQLVLRDTTAPEAQHALPEAVGCYDQLGQRTKADALLERAAQLPALAARARSLQQARQVSAAPAADTLSGDK